MFRLPTRGQLVVAGVILDGTIRTGYVVSFKLQDRLYCSAVIADIEHIERYSPPERLVGLVCDEHDPKEASIYAELCPPGTVVEVREAAA